MKQISKSIGFVLLLIGILLGFGQKPQTAAAQTSTSVLYVPLIGISSVPVPLSLPQGPGNVTYTYAVKNFIAEAPLNDIKVVDDNCGPVKFANGDDNHDGKLDFSETWRYTCTTKLSETTKGVATATGTAGGITANHNAYTTVVVGSNTTPPLVSIVNITKVAYPLALPTGGGKITFTYRVNNPGVVPLGNVNVANDKCGAVSGKLGDTNGNNLLDTNEVWIYTCTATLTQTTTNTATVTAFANGLTATDNTTLTVNVKATSPQSAANLFDVVIGPVTLTNSDMNVLVWVILGVILAALILFFLFRKNNSDQTRPSRFESPRKK